MIQRTIRYTGASLAILLVMLFHSSCHSSSRLSGGANAGGSSASTVPAGGDDSESGAVEVERTKDDQSRPRGVIGTKRAEMLQKSGKAAR